MNIQNLKRSKKGFTLVEIIVVLVIIAILAAIAIPAMVGWIDKANEKADYANARTVLLAAQTIASETYGTKGVVVTPFTQTVKDEVAALALVPGTIEDITATTRGSILTVKYVGTKAKLMYNSSPGAWTKY